MQAIATIGLDIGWGASDAVNEIWHDRVD